jgi:DNA-binding CsgD family transcriptional regulator
MMHRIYHILPRERRTAPRPAARRRRAVEHPVNLLKMLAGLHLHLSADDRELLAMRLGGLAADDIAARTFRAPRTVRARFERLQDLIALSAGRRGRDPWLTGAWVALHLDCPEGCLSPLSDPPSPDSDGE